MPRAQWEHIKEEFKDCCAYCGQPASMENRGIVPDHVIPVTEFGELVVGNTIPACQDCNDKRGEKDWREFLRTRSPADAETRVQHIEKFLGKDDYQPRTLSGSLDERELSQYEQLLVDWKSLLQRAGQLRAAAEKRRQSKEPRRDASHIPSA
jgi:hypothetical protein